MKLSKYNNNKISNSSEKILNNNKKNSVNNSKINKSRENKNTNYKTKSKLKENNSKSNKKKKKTNKIIELKDDSKNDIKQENKIRPKIIFNLKLSQNEISKLIKESKIKDIQTKKSRDNILIEKLNFEEKKILQNLSQNQKSLYQNIEKIKLKKFYFDEYSLNNLEQKNLFYKNIQSDNVKSLEESKNNILQKISTLNQKIKEFNIPNKQKNNILNNSLSNDNFLEKIKQEQKFIVITKKIKKLQFQSNLIDQKRLKEAEYNLEKRNNEMDLIEKEENDKKDKELLDKKNEEKRIVNQRKIETNIKNEKFKQFINNIIPKGRNQNYLYIKMATSFEKNEEKYKNNILKNKTKEEKEINKEFELDRKEFLNKKKLEGIENTKILQQIWKERIDLLPKYVSPIYEKVISSEEYIKENENNKIENKKRLFNIRQNYGKEKIHLPLISNILKRDSEKKDIKRKMTQNKSHKLINKNLLNINLIQMHKRNSDYTNKKTNNLNISKDKNMAKSYSCITLNNNLKNKKVKINYENSNIKQNNKIPGEINYLEGLKKEKMTNNVNKKLDENNNNIINKEINLDIIKGKIEVLEDKYKRGKELLKMKGGYIQNKELGDKMNNILIDSIKSKLDIIENIYN